MHRGLRIARRAALRRSLIQVGQNSGSSGAQNLTVTLVAPVPAGVTLVGAVCSDGGSLASIVDTGSQSWFEAGGNVSGIGHLIYVPNTVAMAVGDTIKVIWSFIQQGRADRGAIFAYIPDATASSDDAGNATAGTATTMSSGSSGALTAASDIVIGVVAHPSANSFTEDGNFATFASLTVGSTRLSMAYRLPGSTAAVTYQPVQGSSSDYRSAIGAFKRA